jgi:hypothetical protein
MSSSRPEKDRRDHSAVYEQLVAQIGDLREQLGDLPGPLEAPDVWHDILVQETHHSTGLEGNTLSLEQVNRVLDDKRADGSAPSDDSPRRRRD